MTRYYMDDSIYLKCYFSTGIDPAINFDFVKGLVKNKYTENIKKSTPVKKDTLYQQYEFSCFQKGD